MESIKAFGRKQVAPTDLYTDKPGIASYVQHPFPFDPGSGDQVNPPIRKYEGRLSFEVIVGVVAMGVVGQHVDEMIRLN